MTVTNILKVLTKWVRKNKGVKEAFLFFVNYIQPIEQYFKNEGDITFDMSISSIKSTCGFEPGQCYRMKLRSPGSVKIHIKHVLPSIYEGQTLVVYSFYAAEKRKWIEYMEVDWMLTCNIIKKVKS
jgi:hypothetical protein